MDATLARLLLLRLRGGTRHRLRQLASPTGLLSFTALVAALWFVVDSGVLTLTDGAEVQADIERLREDIADFMPLGLLAATLFTTLLASGSPLHFSATEINFLFAGPFTRRSLLAYKFCVYLSGAMVNAAIITLLIPPRASSALAAFAACALTLLFIQMASATLTLSNDVLGSSRAGPWRRPAAGLLIIAAAGLFAWHASVDSADSLIETLRQLRRSWAGEMLLAPFTVFARIFLARESVPDLIAWTSAGIAINAGLLCAIVALDRRGSDRLTAQSSRASKRRDRITRGGALWSSQGTTGRSFKRAPSLGGVGPIAWRQAINAYRDCGRVIVVFMAVAVVAGPLLAHTVSANEVGACVAIIFFFATFILPKALVLDFRGEFDSIEFYKALPITAWRICAGQVVVAMLVSSSIELVLIAGIWLFVDDSAARLLQITALFVLPLNLVLYAVENLIFLLRPTRPVPVGRVDFEFVGRTVVEYFGKALIIVAATALSAAIGFQVLAATSQNGSLSLLVCWLTLSAIGLGLVVLCALAFRRFQVSETIA